MRSLALQLPVNRNRLRKFLEANTRELYGKGGFRVEGQEPGRVTRIPKAHS